MRGRIAIYDCDITCHNPVLRLIKGCRVRAAFLDRAECPPFECDVFQILVLFGHCSAFLRICEPEVSVTFLGKFRRESIDDMVFAKVNDYPAF